MGASVPLLLPREVGVTGTSTHAIRTAGSYKLIIHPRDPRHHPTAVLARLCDALVTAVEIRAVTSTGLAAPRGGSDDHAIAAVRSAR